MSSCACRLDVRHQAKHQLTPKRTVPGTTAVCNSADDLDRAPHLANEAGRFGQNSQPELASGSIVCFIGKCGEGDAAKSDTLDRLALAFIELFEIDRHHLFPGHEKRYLSLQVRKPLDGAPGFASSPQPRLALRAERPRASWNK
jgi:hypothetical protein